MGVQSCWCYESFMAIVRWAELAGAVHAGGRKKKKKSPAELLSFIFSLAPCPQHANNRSYDRRAAPAPLAPLRKPTLPK